MQEREVQECVVRECVVQAQREVRRKSRQYQEASESTTFGRHVQIPIQIIYLESSR